MSIESSPPARLPADLKVSVASMPVHRDARGWVMEPIQADQLQPMRNCHVVLTLPGEIRGNHYHQHTLEIITILGPARVRFRSADRLVDLNVAPDQACQLTIPPGLAHAIQNTGQGPGLLVAFTTALHDPVRPDVVREILLTASEPFPGNAAPGPAAEPAPADP